MRISSFEALSHVTNEGGAYPKYWTAIIVKINTEKKVAEKLESLGIQTYVPVQTEWHKWSDRRKKINRIVMPMVLFVRIDKVNEKKLLSYSFIYKFITYPGERKPAVIPDKQIDTLKFMLNQSDIKVDFKDCTFELGSDVRIVRGPLRGLCGKLRYFDQDKPTVGINMDLFGHACVSINKCDIEKINI